MRIKYARKRLSFVMYRSPQARNQEGAKPPPEKFSPPQKKCVGRILKLLEIVKKMSPSEKAHLPPRCSKLVTGLEVQQTIGFPSSLLRHYQIPECFYFNNCSF